MPQSERPRDDAQAQHAALVLVRAKHGRRCRPHCRVGDDLAGEEGEAPAEEREAVGRAQEGALARGLGRG